MAIAVRQSKNADFANQVGGVVTLDLATLAGSVLVIVIPQQAATTASLISSITDNGPAHAAYTTPAALNQVGPPPADNQSGVNSEMMCAFLFDVPAGITTVTVTLVTAKPHSVNVIELTGAETNSAVAFRDSKNGGGSVAATTFFSTSVTPAVDDFVLGAINQAAAVAPAIALASSLPTSGWTELTAMAPGTSRSKAAWKIATAASAHKVAWTGTSGKWGAIGFAIKPAVVGAALTQGINDAFALADSVTSAPSPKVIDALALADANTKDSAKALTEALALADVISLGSATQIDDALALTDVSQPQRGLVSALSDAFALADAISGLGISTQVVDALALADAESVNLVKALTEAFALADTQQPQRGLVLALSDALPLGDSDNLEPNPGLSVIGDWVVAPSSRPLSDLSIINGQLHIAAAPGAGAIVGTTAPKPHIALGPGRYTLRATVNLVTNPGANWRFYVDYYNAAGGWLAQDFWMLPGTGVQTFDIPLTMPANTASIDYIVQAEAVPVGQGAEFYIDTIQLVQGTNVPAVGADPALDLVRTQVLADALALADSTQAATGRVLADVLALSDAQARAMTTVLTDALTLADNAVTAMAWSRLIADPVALADAFTYHLGGADWVQAIADNLALSDAVAEGVGMSIADALALADLRSIALARLITDLLALSDELTPAAGRQISILDAIAFTDAFSLAIETLVDDVLALVDDLAFEVRTEIVRAALKLVLRETVGQLTAAERSTVLTIIQRVIDATPIDTAESLITEEQTMTEEVESE